MMTPRMGVFFIRVEFKNDGPEALDIDELKRQFSDRAATVYDMEC